MHSINVDDFCPISEPDFTQTQSTACFSRSNSLADLAVNETDLLKYHTTEEMEQILQSFQNSFPTLISAFVIGQSYGGKQIWAVEITDNSTVAALTKPATLYCGQQLSGFGFAGKCLWQQTR